MNPPRDSTSCIYMEIHSVANRRPHRSQLRIQHLLLVFTVFVLVNPTASQEIEQSDRYALLAFKSSISSDPQAVLRSWSLAGSSSPCTWNGIRCDHQRRVIALTLSDSSLAGFIPREIQALTHLQRINLRNNSLSGSIPAEITRVRTLHKIILSDNRLSGDLPQSLNQLPALEYLDASGNLLQGSIPGGLNRLQYLNLSRNSLTGGIPQDLALQPNASVDLSHNALTGGIPRGLRGAPPAAFTGNSGLCGAPLEVPCGVPPVGSTVVGVPRGAPPHQHELRSGGGGTASSGGLSVKEILAIAVGDAVGIVLLGLVFIYCFRRNKLCEYLRRRRRRRSSKRAGDSEDEDDLGGSNHCCILSLCFCCCSCCVDSSDWGDDYNGEGELVLLDTVKGGGDENVLKFDLEDLLRASAYVLSKRTAGGIVYKAVLDNGVTLAVRRLPGDPNPHRRNHNKAFESAVQIIGRIRHPCIVPLRAYYSGPDEKLLVYDYIPNGTLSSALHGQAAPYSSLTALTWAERVKIARRVAEGVCYIHECGPRRYIHGDIRSKNILLSSNMDAFVADFGLNKLITVSGSANMSRSGSRNANSSASLASQVVLVQQQQQQPALSSGFSAASMEEESELKEQRIEMEAYRPPEARLGSNKPTQKWDVYAFGVVLLELISGRSATQHLKQQQQQQQRQKKQSSQQQQQVVNGGDESWKALPLVEWAQKMWEGKRPVYELLDPTLMHGIAPQQKDVAEFLKISLSCIVTASEQRPKMKHVCESLKKLGG